MCENRPRFCFIKQECATKNEISETSTSEEKVGGGIHLERRQPLRSVDVKGIHSLGRGGTSASK